jgi:hypothetical protein
MLDAGLDGVPALDGFTLPYSDILVDDLSASEVVIAGSSSIDGGSLLAVGRPRTLSLDQVDSAGESATIWRRQAVRTAPVHEHADWHLHCMLCIIVLLLSQNNRDHIC